MERLPLHTVSVDESTARQHRRRLRAGLELRVGYGVSTPTDAFRGASEQTRHLARVEAVVARSRPGLIVSHQSAVVLHGLPWFGPLPERVILTDTSRDRAQRLRFSDKVAARGRDVATERVAGMDVTDLAGTAVDIALRCDRGHAIVVADAVARRGVPREALLAELERRPTHRGAARARRVLELADARIESPGESLTNLVAHDLRLPAPILQHEFRVGGRLVARVDFWFPEAGVVVEFDGLAKYRERDLRGGRSAGDVVAAEKIREDEVRALEPVSGVARVTWRDVLPGGDAPSVFRRAGLPVPTAVRRTPAW